MIYGVGYRKLSYQPTAMWNRLWPIASMEFRSMFRNRLGVIGFLLCQGPAIGSLVILMVQLGVWKLTGGNEAMAARSALVAFNQESRANPFSVLFFINPVLQESRIPFIVLTFLVSCRAIAKDRAANALEIYWTRGITPWGYFLAKWFGSFLLLGVGFIALPALLWLLGILMASDSAMWDATIGFMPRVLLSLSLFTLLMSGLAVGFSSLSRSPNLSSILWLFLIIGSSAFGLVLSRVFRGQPWLRALSPWDAASRLVEWGSGVESPGREPIWAASMVLGIIVLLLAIAVMRRLRLREAVL